MRSVAQRLAGIFSKNMGQILCGGEQPSELFETEHHGFSRG